MARLLGTTTRSHRCGAHRLALAAAVVALLMSSGAHAQSTDSKDEATEHFEKAEAHMKVGAYDDAIREYEAAYAIAPKPGFYYDIGRAYELKGDKKHALEYFLKYLELEPNGPASTEARMRSVTLEHELAEAARARDDDEQRSDAEPEEPDASQPSAAGPRTATRPTAQPAEDARVVSPPRADVHSRGRGYKIAGASLAGVGVALLGTAIYYGLQVSSADDDLQPYYDGDKPWDDAAVDLEAEGKRASTRANLLYGVGAGAVVGGAVLFYLGMRRGHTGSAGVAVVPRAEGGAAVTWACAF